jgi:general secretion pathway protein E
MRDRATAEIAIQAALTGHLVLSTLHTNNAASTITRLLDMGVEDYLVTSTLNGALGQRLARRLCEHCREAYRALPELVRQLRLAEPADDAPITLYRPRGCERCNGSGYFGRTAITELLIMSDTISRLVLKHAEAREIQRAAVSEGMTTMYEDGMIKARGGITSVEEVLRVTRDD